MCLRLWVLKANVTMLSPLNFHLNAMNYLHFEMLDKTLALYPCVGNNIGVPRAGPRAASRAFFFPDSAPTLHSTLGTARPVGPLQPGAAQSHRNVMKLFPSTFQGNIILMWNMQTNGDKSNFLLILLFHWFSKIFVRFVLFFERFWLIFQF